MVLLIAPALWILRDHLDLDPALREVGLGEPRVLLDLDAPALIVGQVQVEPVELVQRQQVDRRLHLTGAHQRPRLAGGHRQAEQPLEPRGRSAEVQRLLLRLAPMFLPTRSRCTEAGPEGNVGEGERQQQHPQGALQSLRTPTEVPSWFRDRLAEVNDPQLYASVTTGLGASCLMGR